MLRDEESRPGQSAVAHHQILYTQSRPPTVALSRDALAREPSRHLVVVVTNVPYRGPDEGRLEGVVVG